jgi:hypothetical protein
MEKIPKMVDLQLPTPGEGMPEATNLRLSPQYPYGTQICLNEDVIKKTGLDAKGENPEVGDLVHFHCMAKLTSVSDREGAGKRMEFQIVALSAHDEDGENEEAEEKMPPAKLSADKMYNK